MAEQRAPAECANCGAAIPRGAKACPSCGADERTGWREQSAYDDIDLPDEAYTDGDTPPNRRLRQARDVNGIRWYWWCVGVALVIFLSLSVLALL